MNEEYTYDWSTDPDVINDRNCEIDLARLREWAENHEWTERE